MDNYEPLLELYKHKELWKGCFQSMSYISHDFLQKINKKYNLYNLVKYVDTQEMYSCFERVFAVMFTLESDSIVSSISGDFHFTSDLSLTYNKYLEQKPNMETFLTPFLNIMKQCF